MFPISVTAHLFLATTTMSAAVSAAAAAAAAPTIGALPLTTSTQTDSTGTDDPSTSSPLLPPPSPLTSKPLQIGDTLCLEGSVTDLHCHRRDPSVERHLFEPELPSIRSLLDVDRCIHSGYDLLLDLDSPSYAAATTTIATTAAASETNNNNATTTNTTNDNNDDDIHNHHHSTKRKYPPRTIRIRLDPTDISPVQAPTRLSDHSSSSSDVPFRITVIGTVTHLDDHDGSTPFTLRTFQITHSSAICPSHEAVLNLSDVDNDYTKMVFWHGSLMIVGWGWMLPSGVIVARFGKHREGAWWFRLHRVLQSLGLAVALVAWIMALVKFHVFGRDNGGGGGEGKAYYHGVVGIIIMTLGWIQPMIAFVRPPNEEDIFVGGVKSTTRIVWEGVHKSVGYLAILLAVGNIVVGTTLVPMMADRRKFQLGYGIGAVGAVVILMVALLVDGRRWTKRVLEERKENRPSFLGPLLGNEDLVPL